MHHAHWQYRELVEGLRALKPKKRGNPVSWIVLMGCASVFLGLGLDASVREAILSPPSPHNTPAFTAPAPILPAGVRANTRVAMPVIFVPPQSAAPQPVAPTAAEQDDGPLPHAKARNAAPQRRAHSAKHRR